MRLLPSLALATLLAAGASGLAADEDAPAPTGTIVGRVSMHGEAGVGRVEVRPVGDAATYAEPIPGEPVASAPTDEQGRFRFADLPCARYELRAIVDGHMDGCAYASVLEDLTLDVVVPVLDGPDRVSGRIAWRNGRPFAGHVRLSTAACTFTPFWDSQEAAVAKTSADGGFAFEHLPPGDYSISAFDGERRFGLPDLHLPVTGDVALCVDALFRRVHGRVVDDATGAPLEATVQPRGWGGWDHATTDADGRFEIWAYEGCEGLLVDAVDHVRAVPALPKGGDPEVAVRMHRGGTVEGRVRDAEGKAVEGVMVWSVRTLSDDGWVRQLLSATSDAEGRYVLDGVAAGTASVFALGPEHATPDLDPFQDEGRRALAVNVAEGGTATRDLVVGKAASLAIRVKDAAGHPVRHALVEVVPDWGHYSFWGSGATRAWRWGRTDRDGRVEFPTFLPGRKHGLTVTAPGRVPLEVAQPPVAPGEAVERTIVLPAARQAWIHVVDAATGEPVAGAAIEVIQVWWEEGVSGTLELPADLHTDEQGELRVDGLPEGTLEIEARSPGYTPGRAELPASGEVTIALEAGTAVVGRVEGPEGLAGRTVLVTLDSADFDVEHLRDMVHRAVSVPVGGTFRFEDLRPARYEVSCTYEDEERRCEASLEVTAPAEDVVLRLRDQNAVRLDLRILDPDGAPVPRARIVLYEQSGEAQGRPPYPMRERPERLETEVEGGRYERLLGGDDRLVAVHVLDPRSESGERLPLGAAAVGPVEVKRGEPLVVRLSETQRLEGHVRDEAEHGIAGVHVRARHTLHTSGPLARYFGTEAHAEAVTDAEGHFVLEGLGKLEYDVGMEEMEGYAPPRGQRVTPPRAPLDLRLDHATVHEVRVLSPDGRPVPNASVEVLSAGGEDGRLPGETLWRGRTDADGWARVALTPGAQVRGLRVDPPSTREDLASTRLPGLPEGGEAVTLARGYVIEGTVVDAGGDPRAGVLVRCTAPDGGRMSLMPTDGRGGFRFTQLPEGTYEVTVRSADGTASRGPGTSIRVAAGTRDVKLLVE